MKVKALLILLILAMMGTACSAEKRIEITYNIKSMPGGNFQETLRGYFRNFNNAYAWKEYSTDSFVKNVYVWCTGDSSEEKTIAEMVAIIDELDQNTLDLIAVEINAIEISENEEVYVYVARTWENDATDETTYVLVLEEGSFKFDNRL